MITKESLFKTAQVKENSIVLEKYQGQYVSVQHQYDGYYKVTTQDGIKHPFVEANQLDSFCL